MEFSQFKKTLQEHFKEIMQGATHLFEVGIDKDEFWNLYLDSFPAGTNEIYRERREYDCSCCRQFIRAIGNAVVIKDNKITTLWDLELGDTTFQPVADALSTYIKSHAVTDVYVSQEKKIGTDKNREQLENGQINTYEHFYLELPDNFVFDKRRSIGDIKGKFRDTRNVFKRSLDEITEESVLTVLELIAQNSLYKGEEWKAQLTQFLQFKKAYDKLQTVEEKENYAWEKSVTAGEAIGRIRNHSIGTLLVDISEGTDLDTAVRKYEQIVAPTNYKRPKAIYTKKMLEEARQKIEELGYMPSLERRFATLDDISINNILFSNRDAQKRITGAGNVFDEMGSEIPENPKKYTNVEEVGIEKFVKDVLPTAKGIEVFLENRHIANMVSLIAPKNADAPTMFKWDNGFSWAYTGNITDSHIKENVKSAGGKVDGDLRFSIQWNDEEYNPNDFDAHCKEPYGYEILYVNKRCYSPSRGVLDVDIINPTRDVPAVENITYESRRFMKDGTYKFFVHCYTYRGGRSGFKAEVEFDGQIHSFEYDKPLREGEKVQVAEVTLRNGVFSIKELLPSTVSTKEVWGLKTNQFVPVSVIMFSPNYWNEQEGIGHRHYFFMLRGCVNNEMPNGMFNEFLKNELMEHKRVFEALGSKMHVEDNEDQLSGAGFSATKRNSILVKVIGASERVIRVIF